MRSIADLLSEQPVFAGLDAATLEWIAGCGVNTGFAIDDVLLREGEPAETFFVLRSGRVALETYERAEGLGDHRDARTR